ncbi:MAG: sulfite exporter TauE/SafE family protein [Methylotenera sp.]|nr:sulfite exporter TauE/SafE family protein [Methylotenera sp.]MSP98919.1 sulfite exporter TauE/SafE family protein [Methylotenera sp.]
MPFEPLLLIPLIFFAALLFSSVGHGGASAYLAAMALVGIVPAEMRPAALLLNISVAAIAVFKFYRAGAFSWRIFLPLGLTAIPAAFIGGTLSLPSQIYKPAIGLVLLLAAWHVFSHARRLDNEMLNKVSAPILLSVGAVLGFLAGLTGIGGGVFLSPLLLFFKWGETKVISGVAAAFILVNSIAGLLGVLLQSPTLPKALPYWLAAAVLGGLIGAEYGSRRFANPSIRKLLALVLLLAGAKMVFSA